MDPAIGPYSRVKRAVKPIPINPSLVDVADDVTDTVNGVQENGANGSHKNGIVKNGSHASGKAVKSE